MQFGHKLRIVVFVLFLTLLNCITAASIPPGYSYLSPPPGSDYRSPETTLLLRLDGRLDPTSVHSELFEVHGSISEHHPGETLLADDGRTVIFQPDQPFADGETVQVTIRKGFRTLDGHSPDAFRFAFSVSATAAPSSRSAKSCCDASEGPATPKSIVNEGNHAQGRARDYGVNHLPPDFPNLQFTTDNPTDGYIFTNVWEEAGYGMILDNQGEVVWYRRSSKDLKVLANGNISFRQGQYIYEMDNTYAIVDSFEVAGYLTDGHDFLLLENGHSLLIGKNPQLVDMSQIVPGGDPEAVVYHMLVQEQDENHNVVWEWHTADHFEITDAISIVDLTADEIDYAHINSLELDDEGNLLISSRMMSECTAINRQTGEILWRFGGFGAVHEDFTFVNDNRSFSDQHDFRFHPQTNTYTLFDNGNFHETPYASAVEYQLDTLSMEATLVRRFPENQGEDFGFAGSVRKLPNGNMIIGWGGRTTPGLPLITEVTPDNEIALDVRPVEPSNAGNYRAIREIDWTPGLADRPWLNAHFNEADWTLTLNYPVFGDAEYDVFYVYQGTTPFPTQLRETTTIPRLVIDNLSGEQTHYFRVRAERDGEMTGYSNEAIVEVSSSDVDETVPSNLPNQFSMAPVYPNPFNPATTIVLNLPTDAHLNISLFNTLGQRVLLVADQSFSPGEHRFIIDGSGLASGTYILRAEMNGLVSGTRKLTLLR